MTTTSTYQKCALFVCLGYLYGLCGGSPMDPKAMSYLSKYGYLKNTRSPSSLEMKESVMNFQRMANLEMTGELDSATMRHMQMPRCGVEDMIGSAVMGTNLNNSKSRFMPHSRQRRYTLAGSKWSKNDLTYRYVSYTSDMSRSEQRAAISRALDRWSHVTPLTFTEVTSGHADLLIEFAEGVHSDGPYAAFDGRGGVLAHAYFPEDGDLHFDDAEHFTVFTSRGTDLDFVALHELGHSLGLVHSDVRGAVMQPIYPGYNPDLQLHNDDISGIQNLYGRPTGNNDESSEEQAEFPTRKPDNGNDESSEEQAEFPTRKPDKPDGEIPDSCTTNFDAVFTDSSGETFAVKGKHIWKLTDDGIADGYPVKLNKEFSGLPGNINTGFTAPNGRTYFFKGTRYWRFYGHHLEPGYPRSLRGTGVPRNPDAAFVWSGDGKIYFFKGSRYYIWSDYTEAVIPGGVRDIRRHWRGVPTKVDAAFTWMDGKTYFFKGDKYYQYDDMKMKVAPGYPKSKSTDWLGCM
ncbi:matrix metalloproteinase-19-like [Ptychodera flava]|uniref:matrix metalloproteinase-19-like n=1 Tax=Ptychodera flava TaxID=63121 RepID=UPI00396A2AFD